MDVQYLCRPAVWVAGGGVAQRDDPAHGRQGAHARVLLRPRFPGQRSRPGLRHARIRRAPPLLKEVCLSVQCAHLVWGFACHMPRSCVSLLQRHVPDLGTCYQEFVRHRQLCGFSIYHISRHNVPRSAAAGDEAPGVQNLAGDPVGDVALPPRAADAADCVAQTESGFMVS